MVSSKNKIATSFDGKYILIGLLLLGGILIRFYNQFVEWSFNGDEVNLGLGIVYNDFKGLFAPLPNGQSAPPLFLLIQKLITPIAKPYISLKILNFLTSCGSLFLFHRILKYSFPFYLQIIILALFCFNPFIISNSLTLKQYSLDLILGLVAVNYFINNRSAYKILGFFSVFCLLSNVGLFFCVSLSIFLFFSYAYKEKNFFNWKGLKRVSPFLLAPILYLLYFIWFLEQPGAENLKNYMVGYWSGAFMPMDSTIFKWLAIQGKVLMLFFFSTYWALGVPALLFFLFSIFVIFKNTHHFYQLKLLRIIFIYIIAAIIHLFLSAIKIYPFSDRLFLYLAPGIYLMLGFGILELHKNAKKRSYGKLGYFGILVVLSCTILLYFTYIPGKTNDVVGLMKLINSTEQTIAFTPKAKKTSLKWLTFTQYDSVNPYKLVNTSQFNLNNYFQADLLVAIQSMKFGHIKKFTTPEPIIEQLLFQNKIYLYDRVGGYAIYKINDRNIQ